MAHDCVTALRLQNRSGFVGPPTPPFLFLPRYFAEHTDLKRERSLERYMEGWSSDELLQLLHFLELRIGPVQTARVLAAGVSYLPGLKPYLLEKRVTFYDSLVGAREVDKRLSKSLAGLSVATPRQLGR